MPALSAKIVVAIGDREDQNPPPMALIEIRCHSCNRCLGEISDNSSGRLLIKCQKCKHGNDYQMPTVNPESMRRANRAAPLKKSVASP